MLRLFPAVALLAVLSGCAASQASNKDSLPEKNVAQCKSLCASAGMPLESIVIVANQTGCVCGASPDGGSAAATGGAVAVLLAEQQRRQQQQQQQQQQ